MKCSTKSKGKRVRSIRGECILDYPDVSILPPPVLQLYHGCFYCKDIFFFFFTFVLSGTDTTWETDCEACACSLFPTGYAGGGSCLSVTPVVMACTSQIFGHVSVSRIFTWPPHLKQSSVGLSVLLARPFGLSLLQRTLLLV